MQSCRELKKQCIGPDDEDIYTIHASNDAKLATRASPSTRS